MADDPLTVYKIPLHAVRSSNIAALGYDDAKQILAVQFMSGEVFHYAGISDDLATQLLQAESIGKFYHSTIRGKFQAQKMTGPCPECGDSGYVGETCADCGTAFYQDSQQEARSDESGTAAG